MSKPAYSFRRQLKVGRRGVKLAKDILSEQYETVMDLDEDMAAQRRGIDVFVPSLGYLEIKCETYAPKNVFLEIEVAGKPGAIDRSCADYLAYIYPDYGLMLLLPRPELQKWLRENWSWILRERRKWVKKVRSAHKGRKWQATGIAIPINVLLKDLEIVLIEWED